MRDWGEPTSTPGGAMDPRPGRHRLRRSPRPLTGQLLVASPTLEDPNFDRAVVYLLSHDRSGAFGVVINRATEVAVHELIAGWDSVIAAPQVMFEGGPVEPDAAVCLAKAKPGVAVSAFQQVDGLVGTLDVGSDPTAFVDAAQIAEIRVFRGYAGWAPGQLASEIDAGAWIVLESLPSDAFTPTPDDLWQLVLRRQGGMLSAVGHFPPDLRLN